MEQTKTHVIEIDTQTQVKELCDSIMRGVVATGVITEHNMQAAVDIMKDETKALLTGEDGRYAEQRECIQRGTLHEAWIIADVVTECAKRLRAE